MASELGLNPKKAKRAGLLHDIGKVPDDEPELPHAILGMKLCEKYKEKPDICNAVGAHHDEVEMQTLLAPIVQVCDAISGARPGARREIVEAYIKRLNDLEQLALSYPGVVKTYAIQAGRELRVIVGADKIDDKDTENLSAEIAKKIQDEMTYPGQVKITVIRETRAVATLSKNIININKKAGLCKSAFFISVVIDFPDRRIKFVIGLFLSPSGSRFRFQVLLLKSCSLHCRIRKHRIRL